MLGGLAGAQVVTRESGHGELLLSWFLRMWTLVAASCWQIWGEREEEWRVSDNSSFPLLSPLPPLPSLPSSPFFPPFPSFPLPSPPFPSPPSGVPVSGVVQKMPSNQVETKV